MKFWKRYFPVLLISLYFLWLAHRGLKEDFNSDDTMNLSVAYVKPLGVIVRGAVLFWTGYIRPLGALFYLLVYSYAGFWSLPFRIICFALILVNFALVYRLFLKLTKSRVFAALALLVVCFHASLGDIYASTGTVYDILCQLFMLTALNLCVGHERPLSFGRLAAVTLCAIAAVDSKEVGVTIPAILLAYELIFHTPGRRNIGRWAKDHLPAVGLTGLVSAVFMWSRLVHKNDLSNHEYYQVILTAHQYLLTTKNYINLLLFRGNLNEAAALAVLLLPLAGAALLRSRLMLFGWIYFVLALAPMSFSAPRAGYALYIPYTGVAILLAAAARRREGAVALIAIATVIVQIRQNRAMIALDEHPWGQDPIHLISRGVGSRYPSMPKGSRILMVNDPFGPVEYQPAFVLWLRYRDPTLKVDKSTWQKASGPFQFPAQSYDHVFLFSGNACWELRKDGENPMDGRPLPFVAMRDSEADLSIVKDIGGISPGEQTRWANQDPALSFRVPARPAKFRMDFEVPGVILATTGTLQIQCWIADKPAPGLTIKEPGKRTYEAPLPAGLRPGDVAHVRFHVENPYIAKGDGARL
ncbi:MAG: hypothetical protein JWO80_3948, partial [Bryobacterales bacterium]|nr:hypothetical protein [Bryobacterales bacterium]